MHNAATPSGGQPENHRAGSPAIFNATAEAARLRQTIALADIALREAADHRSERHAPGETYGETQDRWNEAAAIEQAAKVCRKAARKALAAVAVFRDVHAPEEIAAKIEAARSAALNLKHAIDLAQRDHAQRQIRLAARDLKRQIADCHAITEGAERRAADLEAERKRLDLGAESPARIERARLVWIAEEAAKNCAAEMRREAARLRAQQEGGAQ